MAWTEIFSAAASAFSIASTVDPTARRNRPRRIMRVAHANRPVIRPRTTGGEDYPTAFDLPVVDLPVPDDAPPAEPLYVPMVFDTANDDSPP